MRTVKLTSRPPSVPDLLRMAREESLLITGEDGETYLITHADDFETEVQLLRRNHAFLTLLDELKRDDSSIPLAEAEQKLR